MELKDREILTNELKEFAASLDIDLIGIANLDEMNKNGKPGRKPVDIVPTANSIIVFGVGFLDSLFKCWSSPQEILTAPGSPALNILFVWEMKFKKFLRERNYSAYGYMEARGLFKIHIRQAHAFQQAGLGYVGKSNLAISKKYGPRMNIMTILTDAPLIADDPFTENYCDECDFCQRFCTSGAILGDGFYNARLCESVINCQPNCLYFSLSGWHDCDMCYRKCPQGEYKWSVEERKGTWWDIVHNNRENIISHSSSYLRNLENTQKES